MADTRVLLLTGQQAVIYHWRGRRLVEPMAFGADDAGLRAFAGYLEGDATTPLRILLDVVEEEFREESIPHVLFGDRDALVRTRTARLFRDARFAHAEFQGRETEGRRDDTVLFSAITRPDILVPWLTHIARYKVPLAGIHSLPLLSTALLKKIPVTEHYALLVSVQSTGGLRQSFFIDQKLKMSRLAVMPRLTLGQYAAYILAEAERVRRYLNSLRLLTRELPLDIYLLAQGDVMDDLRQQVTETAAVRFHFVDLTALGNKLRVQPALQTPYADAIFSHLLTSGRAADHYGRAEDTRYFQMHRARAAMMAASALLLVGGIGWSGYRFVQGAITEEQTHTIARQAQFFGERLQRARASLPPAPADANEIRRAVRLARTLEGYRTSPLPVMALVSRALGEHPSVQLDAMDWKVAMSPEEGFTGASTARASAPPADVEPGTRFGIVALRGRVEPFDGDFRAALDTVSNFSDTLRDLAGVRDVQALSLPLDLSSERRLQGSLDNEQRVASFELRLVMDIPPPPPPPEPVAMQ